MNTARHLSITGRVQGVGYRDSLRAEAGRQGCTGWVRNRRDGSVEAVVEGSPDAAARLVDWARRGPPAARVDDVRVSETTGGYTGFEIRPTA
jgi:acylphosphatase